MPKFNIISQFCQVMHEMLAYPFLGSEGYESSAQVVEDKQFAVFSLELSLVGWKVEWFHTSYLLVSLQRICPNRRKNNCSWFFVGFALSLQR